MSVSSLNIWLEEHGSEIDAVVLDVDGVLTHGGERLPGARALLQDLRSQQIPYLLLTNDGDHSVEEKAAYLERAGLFISASEIISCAQAIVPFVKQHQLHGEPFFIIGDLGQPCYAQAAGLETTRDLDKLAHCRGVIIGENNYDWQTVINAVVNFFIDHPKAIFIVPNPDEFYPGKNLKISIAAGGVARFIQQVVAASRGGLSVHYLGKPYAPIFRLAQNHLEHQKGGAIDKDRVLMVGDNLASDINGGHRMGYRTALVRTGIAKNAAPSKSHIQPDFVFDRL